MTANFRLLDEQVENIRQKLESEETVEPTFSVEIKDEDGALVAEVQKVLHVRRRNAVNRTERVVA